MCIYYAYTHMYIKKSALQIVQSSKGFHVFLQLLLGFFFGRTCPSEPLIWRQCPEPLLSLRRVCKGAREEMGEFNFYLKEEEKEQN